MYIVWNKVIMTKTLMPSISCESNFEYNVSWILNVYPEVFSKSLFILVIVFTGSGLRTDTEVRHIDLVSQ